jgi:hypothetical protein
MKNLTIPVIAHVQRSFSIDGSRSIRLEIMVEGKQGPTIAELHIKCNKINIFNRRMRS